jgi:prepilin-type processing-associated H-X9-DG protein
MRKWVLGLVVALFCGVGSVRAQPLADRVPGDALIYFGWTGADSMGPGYAGSHLEAVVKASKFQELLNESLPRVFAKIAAQEPGSAEPLKVFTTIGGAMWRHPSAYYFGGMATGPNGQPMPKFALLCDAGAEAKGVADQLRKVLAQGQPPVEIKVEEQGGLVVLSCGAQGWGAGQKPAAALASDAKFQTALAQVQKEPVASVYVNVEGIVALADQMTANSPAAANWAKFRDALGLKAVNRAIATAGFDQKDWMTQAFVESPAPRTGAAAKIFDTAPLSQEILKTVPQSATIMSAGKFDLGGLVTAIRTIAADLNPQAGQQVDAMLAQVHDSIGVDLQKDVFDQFGDEWAAYQDPMTAGSGMLGYAVVNRVKDAKRLEESLTKLEDVINALVKSAMGPDAPTIAVERSQIEGTTLHHLAVPLVSPSWAIRDGNFYLGLYPQVVEGAVEQGAAGHKSILDNEAFQAVRKRLGGGAASGIGFANLPRTAPDGYQQLLMVARLYLGGADLFGAQTPAMAIPPLRKIMPELSPSGDVAWTDAAGWHYKGVSPFPGSDMLTPGGGGQVMVAQEALLVSILLPSLNRARETANRVKCGSNLRQIGQGILLYANENKGNYPPNLGILVKTEELVPQVFICPSGNTGFPGGNMAVDDQVKWVNENSDYVYLGAGMNATAGAEVIVAHEKPDAHGRQGMNMLFGDGHVEFFQMPAAIQMIQAQQAKKK